MDRWLDGWTDRWMDGWMGGWMKERSRKVDDTSTGCCLMSYNLQGSKSWLLALSGGEAIPSGFHDFLSKMRSALHNHIYHHTIVIAGNNHHKLSIVPSPYPSPSKGSSLSIFSGRSSST